MNLRVVGRGVPLVALLALAALWFPAGAGAAGSCASAPANPELELIYRVDAGAEEVSTATRERSAELICTRLRSLGVKGAGVELLVSGEIGVALPQLSPDRVRLAIEVSGAAGQAYFYDWEPNLIGRERAIGGRPGAQPPPGALRAAEREWRAAGRKTERFLNAQLISAGALPTAASASRLAAAAAFETTVVREHPATAEGLVKRSAAPGWYALRDRPALSGADLVEVSAMHDFVGAPTVFFDFTDQGRAAFARVTRRIAERGRKAVRAPVTAENAAALSGHLALVLDGRVVTRPIINFVSNPKGIDGSTGAQISGGFNSFGEARALAAVLGSGALPLELTLVRQLR